MATGDIHTVPRGVDWVNIAADDRDTVLSCAPTHEEAAASGRELARERGVEHIVHRAAGTLGERSTVPRSRDPIDIAG